MLASIAGSQQLSAATIKYEVENTGTVFQSNPVYRYTYTVEGPISQNQELDFVFDPTLFGVLLNPMAGMDFDLMLFQPNNPVGSPGHFSAFAKVDNPSFTTPLSVDVSYLGTGTPGGQIFFLNTYQANGQIASTESGTTIPVDSGGTVPEPGTIGLTGLALVLSVAGRTMRRKSRAPSHPSGPVRQ